jgi:hypothetical protein
MDEEHKSKRCHLQLKVTCNAHLELTRSAFSSQIWLEGTVADTGRSTWKDTSNAVNAHAERQINAHAERQINAHAERQIKAHAERQIKAEADFSGVVAAVSGASSSSPTLQRPLNPIASASFRNSPSPRASLLASLALEAVGLSKYE